MRWYKLFFWGNTCVCTLRQDGTRAAHLVVMLVDYAGLGVTGLDCRFVYFDMLV
jgi:hypothetical protein